MAAPRKGILRNGLSYFRSTIVGFRNLAVQHRHLSQVSQCSIDGVLSDFASQGSKVISDAKLAPSSENFQVAYCHIRLPQDGSGLGLSDLPPLVATMRLRNSVRAGVAIVVGDGSAASDSVGATCSEVHADLVSKEVATLLSHHEELVQQPLPKFRIHRNSEWYNANVIDFLSEAGRSFRIEELHPRSTPSISASSGNLSTFSNSLLRAYDWKRVCDVYGSPVLQLDGGSSDVTVREKRVQFALDYLRSRCNRQCLGIVVPSLYGPMPASLVAREQHGPFLLDERRTDCYEMFQHLVGVADNVVEHQLRLLTFGTAAEIAQLMLVHKESPSERAAQNYLADQVVSLLYGGGAAKKVRQCSALLFRRDVSLRGAVASTDAACESLRFCLRTSRIPFSEGLTYLDVLVRTGCFDTDAIGRQGSLESSGSSASRREGACLQIIRHGGFTVNGLPVKENRPASQEDILASGFTVLGHGRKSYRIILWD